MRILSERSRLARTLIAATTILATATAGIVVGVGIANAVATGPVVTPFNTSILGTKTDTAQRSYSSKSWVTLTTLNMAPTWDTNHALVRFSSQSKCQAGSSDGWCTIRILVNDTEAAPADGTNFVWQWEGNNETWGARSMERTLDTYLGRSVNITVQVAVRGGATSFILQDWILVGQAY